MSWQVGPTRRPCNEIRDDPNFFGETPRSFGNRERLGCLNGSIRRSRGEPSRRACPPHRWLDDDHSASPRRLGDARRLRWARFPLMTQLPKPSGAERRGERPNRVCCKKISILSAFRACSHSSTSPALTQSSQPTSTRKGVSGAVRLQLNRRRTKNIQAALTDARGGPTRSTLAPSGVRRQGVPRTALARCTGRRARCCA